MGQPAYRLSRRKFLQAAIAMTAAGGTGFAVGCEGKTSPWRFLRVSEARTLAAMCDQIIPEDQDPGAAWAGVVNYIDRQLCGPLEQFKSSYRVGISAVDRSSRQLFGKLFPDSSTPQQVELLTRMEHGQEASEFWKDISASDFFQLVVDHTMQGFYGDPRHGGNREAVSWKMLEIPYPPIRGRFRPEGKA